VGAYPPRESSNAQTPFATPECYHGVAGVEFDFSRLGHLMDRLPSASSPESPGDRPARNKVTFVEAEIGC